ncbi:hypothetical protein RvY_01213-1 [Ramazzottius varieornatus]|uniref:X-box-binding protein 1 n=1 Tax=Ramazzottius varieornatus TaxID=947166 RepID=A0A1D1UQV2_RAMVA|nr:hypothetical protein RvY_01213-1 [Ramazzottius varieornatus]
MVGRVTIKKEPVKVMARRVDGHESSPCPSTASEHSMSSSGEKRKVPMDDLFPGDRDKRRKLMNRVAAQQSRDRKKQHLDELEAEVKRLRSENVTLLSKNSTIIKEKEDLRVENENLKKQLAVLSEKKDAPALNSTTAGEEKVSASEISSSVAFESAAFISGPLQQEQVTMRLIFLLMQFLQIHPTTSLQMTSSIFSKKFGWTSVQELIKNHIALNQQVKKEFGSSFPITERWRNRRRSSWTPLKNSCSGKPLIAVPPPAC